MLKKILLTAVAFFTVSAGFTGNADAQRRHRLHSRWITGINVDYLSNANFDTCWAESQYFVAPDRVTYNQKYNSCLISRRYRYQRHHVRNRIARECASFANTRILANEYQQQVAYQSCLRRIRYNTIRDYLVTVTCDHLYGKRRTHCVNRLYRDIATYGYSNPAHLIYLDNLYRTRYRSFRTKYPNHRHVKTYHHYHRPRTVVKNVHHRAPDRVVVKHHYHQPKTVVKHVHHQPKRVVVKHHNNRHTVKKVVVKRDNRRNVKKVVVKKETRRTPPAKRENRRHKR